MPDGSDSVDSIVDTLPVLRTTGGPRDPGTSLPVPE